MHIPEIYNFFQELFPELEEQEFPADSLDHFGQFFDWINLNAIYIQALDLVYYAEHGFEENMVFEQNHIPYGILDQNIQKKIDKILHNADDIEPETKQQEILRLIISDMYQFLTERGFDLLIILINQQKYWFAFPALEESKREEMIHLFKTEFNSEVPIEILEPHKISLFHLI